MNDELHTLVTLADRGGWSTSPTDIRRLLAAAAERPPSGKPTSLAESTVAGLVSAYRKRSTSAILKHATGEDFPGLAGPIIGDPWFGRWPFHDSLALPDEHAVRWLEAVVIADDITPEIRGFVRTMFCTIPRRIWTAAAHAMGRLSVRDASVADELSALEALHLLSGPMRSPSLVTPGRPVSPDALPQEYRHLQTAHLVRHSYVAVCERLAAVGGCSVSSDDLLGITTNRLDDTNLSAVLLGWRALLGSKDGQVQAAVTTAISTLTANMPAYANEQVAAALRHLLPALLSSGGSPAAAGVLAHLQLPRWRELNGSRQIDALVSWLQSARALSHQSQTPSVAGIVAVAGPARDGVALALGEPLNFDPLERLCAHLQVIADATLWDTTSDLRRAVCVAESAWLCEHSEVRAVAWPTLAGRCLPRDSSARAVHAHIRDHALGLAVLVAARNDNVHGLLRDTAFDDRTIVALSGVDNGFVLQQVAVQLDRALRTRPQDEAVHLLWRVLRPDTHAELLMRLATVHPGSTGWLRDVIVALADLDTVPRIEAVGQYVKVTTTISPCVGPQLVAHATALTQAGALAGPDALDEWLNALTTILVPNPSQLVWLDWLEWLEGPPPGDGRPAAERAEVKASRHAAAQRKEHRLAAVHALRQSILQVKTAGRAVTPAHLLDVDRRLDELMQALASELWPEQVAVDAFGSTVQRWRRRLAELVDKPRRLALEIDNLVTANKEDALMALLWPDSDPQRWETVFDRVPVEVLKRAHQFLLDSLNYAAADRIRRANVHRAAFARGILSRAPLLIGSSAGIWLSLQSGLNWQALAAQPFRSFLVLIGLSHATALVMLTVSVVAHVKFGESWKERIRRIHRIGRLYVEAVAVGFGSTIIVLSMFAGLAPTLDSAWWRTITLYGSVSMFLALFLGLIVQGRDLITRG